jgi:hypothetical protein
MCGYVAERRNTFRECRIETEGRAVVHVVPAPTVDDVIRTPAVRLGDAVESVLSFVGITKERVAMFSQSGTCKCNERQEALNQWGYRQQERIEAAAEMLSELYFGGTQEVVAERQGLEEATPPVTPASSPPASVSH